VLLGFYWVLMYDDRTQNYDRKFTKNISHDAPFPLPHHLLPCALQTIA